MKRIFNSVHRWRSFGSLPVLMLLIASICLIGSSDAAAQKRFPGTVSSPESAGWSSEKLQAAEDYSKTIKTAAVMVIYDGRILDQWGETTRKFKCHSIRKSFLSALYGIYVDEGKIDLSMTMKDLGIDDNPPSLTDREKTATVQMLLKARSGVYHPALYETASMKAARPKRYSHAPGTFWYYNNWDFNVLGTVFEQETGVKIHPAFKERIGDPVGMEDFEAEDGSYVRGADSIHPAYPFRMTARDMARFGLLYLRNGKWGDTQIIPESWVKESTASYSGAGQSGGYGYLWWIAVDGRHFPGMTTPEGTYSARGAGGHYILIVPAYDMVIVHRVNTDQSGNRVGSREFGRLFAMILDARMKN